MTHFTRLYSALFALLLLGTFGAPHSFASLKEEVEEKKYVKPIKSVKKARFPIFSLEDYKKKYGKFILIAEQKKPFSKVRNVPQKLEWAKKPNRNIVIYPLITTKDRIIFIKGKEGLRKIHLKGKDVVFFYALLGKVTFSKGPSDTKIPVLKGFLTQGGKNTLTLGELRGK